MVFHFIVFSIHLKILSSVFFFVTIFVVVCNLPKHNKVNNSFKVFCIKLEAILPHKCLACLWNFKSYEINSHMRIESTDTTNLEIFKQVSSGFFQAIIVNLNSVERKIFPVSFIRQTSKIVETHWFIHNYIVLRNDFKLLQTRECFHFIICLFIFWNCCVRWSFWFYETENLKTVVLNIHRISQRRIEMKFLS